MTIQTLACLILQGMILSFLFKNIIKKNYKKNTNLKFFQAKYTFQTHSNTISNTLAI